MKKRKFRAPNRRLTWVFILTVAIILLVAVIILMSTSYILIYFNVVDLSKEEWAGWVYVLVFIASSFVAGLGLSALASRFIMKPINTMVKGLVNLANGDYSSRIDLGSFESMKDLANSFNSLAKELENNEMLHYDFINNFSHEFKTPISSINGLVTLLKNKNLPEEKRLSYLNIIEEEAERLLNMTSNILNLSKVESKSVLNNLEKYNLSEQIRNCILLCEKKWSRKQISLSLEFDEFYVVANEDLMKQVWLNLIDNAIKFAYEKTELKITINANEISTTVLIDDEGLEIAETEKEKIFSKFYQVDSSHSREGNGIGLSIVKHIIELHKGSIDVQSKEGHTIFRIVIPNE